jgi:hypothetical protein
MDNKKEKLQQQYEQIRSGNRLRMNAINRLVEKRFDFEVSDKFANELQEQLERIGFEKVTPSSDNLIQGTPIDEDSKKRD